EAAVVIALRQRDKPFAALAVDEGLSGFALRVERVEILIEALISGLTSVDGAPNVAAGDALGVGFLLQSPIQLRPPSPYGVKFLSSSRGGTTPIADARARWNSSTHCALQRRM